MIAGDVLPGKEVWGRCCAAVRRVGYGARGLPSMWHSRKGRRSKGGATNMAGVRRRRERACVEAPRKGGLWHARGHGVQGQGRLG